MSTEQTVDPELVEQTKQQIRGLVREIAQLAKSDLAPLEFYDALLNRIVAALAAVGGAVWTIVDGRLELQYQINLREARLHENEESKRQHDRLLRKALTSPEGMLIGPHSGSGDEEAGGNPTDYLLVMGPLKSDVEVQGLVEILQRPGASRTVQQGYLRFVLQMCELASDYLKTRQLRHFSDRQTLWAQLENFTRLAHRSLDPRSTAYTVANEGRRLIDCDRVSVAICRGNKAVIEAVSGQDMFDRRSNTVTLLGELATAVTATGETVWYTGDTTLMAPQVEEAVQAYIDEAHSKAVGVIPLKRPQDPPAHAGEHVDPPEVIGALIVEQIEDSQPKQGLQQRVDVVSEHSSIALANALEYHTLFLLPVWETLGHAKWVVKARNLPKTISVAVAVLVVLVFLAICPARFNLEGKGTLQPVDRRDVFAFRDGTVSEVYVKHGDMVTKGQMLAKMRNTELEVKRTDIAGQMTSTQEQILGIRRTLLNQSGKLSLEEQTRLSGQLLQLTKTLASLKNQLGLLDFELKELEVISPIDGQIITWQVKETLIRRPVQTGQILMTVADPNGPWQLEVHMPENRMGFVESAVHKYGLNLETTYILATEPGAKHIGHVTELARKADAKGEEGNVVEIKVAVNKDDFADRRPGATVTSKVNCGWAPIGYVWFHDLIAFVQTKILFRL